MAMLTGSLPRAEALKARISSIEAWRLPQEPGTLAPPGVASNKGTVSPISSSGRGPFSRFNPVL